MNEKKLKEEMISWRQYLHMHPEIAFEETETAKFVANELRKMGLTVHEGIGKTGIVADLKVGEGET